MISNIPQPFRLKVVDQKPVPKGFEEGPLPTYRRHFAAEEGPYIVVDTNIILGGLPNEAARGMLDERIRRSAEAFGKDQGLHLLP